METGSNRDTARTTQVNHEVTFASRQRRARGEATDLVHSRLRQIAEQLGPNARLPRMRALCEELGVSPGTLNLALDKLEQQRILVRRERSGVFVAPSLRQKNVCVIVSPVFFLRGNLSPFWQLLLNRIDTMGREHATRLTVSLSHSFPNSLHNESGENASPLPDYLQSEIVSGNFDGVLAIGLPHPTTRWIESRGVPVVAFAGAARFMVFTSRYALIEEGLKALAEAGCKSVEFWLPDARYWLSNLTFVERKMSEFAKKQGIAQWQIVSPESATAPADVYDFPQIEMGWRYGHARLGSTVDPKHRADGILLSDDMMTLGLLMALPHLDIMIGKDIEIATYANADSPILMGWSDRLYRIEYDLSELVERLYETLEALMAFGAADQDYVPPLDYDTPEVPDNVIINEKVRLIRPRLLRPTHAP